MNIHYVFILFKVISSNPCEEGKLEPSVRNDKSIEHDVSYGKYEDFHSSFESVMIFSEYINYCN